MGHAIILIKKNALLCEICKGGLGKEVSKFTVGRLQISHGRVGGLKVSVL